VIGIPPSPNLSNLGWWAFAVVMMLSLVRMRTRSRALLIVGAAEVPPVIAAAAALTFALVRHDAGASMLPLRGAAGEVLGMASPRPTAPRPPLRTTPRSQC
jgi:hypothetical protein